MITSASNSKFSDTLNPWDYRAFTLGFILNSPIFRIHNKHAGKFSK